MKFVIVGGGTAGWLTALYVKKVFPHDSVTLVESEEIGILGAGEGATPQLVSFLDFLGIHPSDIIKNTGATVKNGIKFTGWSNNQDHYYHPFYSTYTLSNDYNYPLTSYFERDTHFSHMYGAEAGKSINEYSFISRLSDLQKVPFLITDEGYVPVSNWSMHFNAKKLADYLRSVGEFRGITRVEGQVLNIKTNEIGNISSLVLKDNSELNTDFVFDCSGFARILIGKHFKSEWKSHSEHLPAKKALPFFLPNDDKLPPYTESTALNYGWMWKIPVQDRYGCGYVFDSDFISEDQAKLEVEQFLGQEVTVPKIFNFNAGCYKEIWIKNCLAVGLSSGFIEPLEATSIMQAISVLDRFLSTPSNVTCISDSLKKNFNSLYLEETEEVVEFIYLHYVTTKKSTIFWADFIKNNKTPEFILYILDVIKNRPLLEEDFKGRLFFTTYSYVHVLIGNGLLSKEMLVKHLNSVRDDKRSIYYDIVKKQNLEVPLFPSHIEFIEKILNYS
jgi:tryptophan halogenase